MNTNEKFVITINREIGTGGHTIAAELAQRLNVNLYDKNLFSEIHKRFDLDPDEIEQIKAQKHNWFNDLASEYLKRWSVTDRFDIENNVATTENIYNEETRLIKEVVAEESCVITGRSASFILKDHPNHVRVMIYSSMENRIQRVMNKQNVSLEEAKKIIAKVDKQRENYTKTFAGVSRYNIHNYDLVLNVDGLTIEDAVELILDYIKRK